MSLIMNTYLKRSLLYDKQKTLDEVKDKIEIIHWCKELKLNPETERYECSIKNHFKEQIEYIRHYQKNKRRLLLIPNCPEHCKREENGTAICYTIKEKENKINIIEKENKECT